MRIVLSLLLILMMGCSDASQPAKKTFQERMSPFLPAEAKNIKECGNNWFTFEIILDGQTRKYFCRCNPGPVFVVSELNK